jgi:hypothetical protein
MEHMFMLNYSTLRLVQSQSAGAMRSLIGIPVDDARVSAALSLVLYFSHEIRTSLRPKFYSNIFRYLTKNMGEGHAVA